MIVAGPPLGREGVGKCLGPQHRQNSALVVGAPLVDQDRGDQLAGSRAAVQGRGRLAGSRAAVQGRGQLAEALQCTLELRRKK